MGKIVDLRKKPYNLNDEQIAWVEETISNMSDEEKIGQLFFNLFFMGEDKFSGNKVDNKDILRKYHIGGARYMNGSPKQVMDLINELQENSKIPLLVAANCDNGGDGAMKGGTYISSGAQSEASQSERVPYLAGLVSSREEDAVGVNTNFDPCVDILTNWRNTIVNTRSYGTNADDVIKYTSAYLKGLVEERTIIRCIKHFPGDGSEERDQHLVLGVNELSVSEWDDSFRKVYQHHIDNGIEMIMAGHIAQPAYSKKLNPNLKDEDIMPATLAPELIEDLLKEDLGFNGLVITDASHMLGMTSAMKREDYVPRAIASGCDMFLFFNDLEEDFNFMLNGYKKGIITKERLIDANRRILGLKAKLNLHLKKADGSIIKKDEGLKIVGCKEHLDFQLEAAKAAITLVKDTHHNLPISPKTHKRIKLYYLEGEKDGIHAHNSEALDNLIAILKERGYEVSVNDGSTRIKGRTLEYRNNYDLALVVANVIGYGAQNNYRIQWKTAMSSDVPWYTHEVPTIFVSLNYTTHLHDVTMVKTYINAYHSNTNTLNALIDKLEGKDDFKGKYNDLVWCDKWQAKL